MPLVAIIIVCVVVAALVILSFIGIYNGLVNRKIETENAWSQIDVQLKWRYDLIPNLVDTVNGYASHEKETLEKVVQARKSPMNAGGVAQQCQPDNVVT